MATIDTYRLKSHAFGAAVVGFVAGIATMMMAYFARVGPEIFTQLTVGLAILTVLAVTAAAILSVVLILKQQR